ncbi:MAG: electron transfer flavoprotein subunit beta/FixA family protein [Desulfobacterales bacterium]|nr:electron transfer flavoprotein subunit beta/FixA family protein [Desulfobacterales bacterium]
MGLKMIVMVKQVPDTHNISGDAMKPDGTVNRSALPAIFNPEDLNALEEAIKIKEKTGGFITAISMGPQKALDVLRECLYRGADNVVLVTDRRFAGADTLATSYALKCAIETVGEYDLILCGRQAIDGDTAQVGPQIAEKLNINQLTCVSEVVDVDDKAIIVKRTVDDGHEIVKSRFPVLLTVTSEANKPRPPSVKRVMSYKHISCDSCSGETEVLCISNTVGSMLECDVDYIDADPEKCGLSGSPTKVIKVKNVVLTAGNVKKIPNTEAGICDLINELRNDNILG